jgi:hypothetical protein
MCAKFWPNKKAAQPEIFPNQVIYECFECDDAFIGDINNCPKCGIKLQQLYPFHGIGVQECCNASKER